MEWVEVTGKTVEVAQAAALDHLGVHESEAEFDVVSEGRAGVFGLFSQDARVRARVLPKQPRPKQERRPRKGKGGGGGGRGSGGRGGKNGGKGSGRGGRGSDSAGKGSGEGDKRSKSDGSKSDGKGPRQNRKGGSKSQAKNEGSGAGQGKAKGVVDAEPSDSPTDRPLKPRDGEVAETTSAPNERGPRQRNRKKRPGDNAPASTEDASPRTGVADATNEADTSSTKKRSATQAGVAAAAGVGAVGAVQAKSSSDRRPSTVSRDEKQEETMSTDEITVEQQGEIASDFLDGLLEAFGADGEIKSTMVDDDVIEVAVHGKDLGLMIGPKGATLHAIQELARTAVQRSGQGTHRGRLLLDVGGYRQHRRAALEQFAGQVAERVIAENKEHALEPMNSADRKAIHDAVNEIDGVRTISEGEDPRRRIVILPAD